MSQCTFIAANVPLAEVRSPYYSTFSINEAVAAGTALDADILGCGIDPDEPDVVLACDPDSGKDPADNFSLLEFPFARCYCDMDLAVSIELGGLGPADMTPEKARASRTTCARCSRARTPWSCGQCGSPNTILLA